MTTQNQAAGLVQTESAGTPEESAEASLALSAVLRRPYPHLKGDFLTRFLTRTTLLLLGHQVVEVHGFERIRPEHDPFIFVLNHSKKNEAVLIPGVLFHARGGKRVHFIADWNFCLIPGVFLFYYAGQVITLVRKPARPRFLNAFKPLFTDAVPAYERAAQRLKEGSPVGIFPEGTTNRDSTRLLRGFNGAAKLSLQTGVKIIPAGITFPGIAKGQRISEFAQMRIDIGHPMQPAKAYHEPDSETVNSWHAQVMREIARLTGKDWEPSTSRR